jgi:hypothetical protein
VLVSIVVVMRLSRSTLVEGRFQELRCRGKSAEEWFCPAGYVDGNTFGSNCELCLACDRDGVCLFVLGGCEVGFISVLQELDCTLHKKKKQLSGTSYKLTNTAPPPPTGT